MHILLYWGYFSDRVRLTTFKTTRIALVDQTTSFSILFPTVLRQIPQVYKQSINVIASPVSKQWLVKDFFFIYKILLHL